MRMVPLVLAALSACAPLPPSASASQAPSPHNVILFVADGLRGRIVDARTAPAMAELRDRGSYFPNSHSLFPTFTTANASAIATGHQLGDTGDFSNTIYTARPVASAGGSVTPFLENDAVLREVDAQFGGNHLDEETLLEAARRAGYGTAAVGKLGPALIQDHLAADGSSTIVLDDSTGAAGGVPCRRRSLRPWPPSVCQPQPQAAATMATAAPPPRRARPSPTACSRIISSRRLRASSFPR